LARVLVLDGHSAAALAFTRSLGRAKHWVAVGSNLGIHSPADFSRYCRLSVKYPVPSENVSAFAEAVLEIARKNSIDLIVPVTDWTVLPLSKYREQFHGVSRLAIGPHSALEFAGDKFKTVSLARELRIPVPETALIQSLDDLHGIAANFDFPVVVKDRFSARWEGNRAIMGSVSYAYSRGDLEQKVEHRLKEAGDVLVQQFVSGEGIGFSCMAVDEDLYLPFMWLRLREIDPRGSGSSARKSIPITDQVRESSSALIKRVGLQGISMVEFKRQPNGEPILMEINARPWGSLQLPISSGIDYPVHLVNWLLDGKLPPREIEYKQGIMCRRLVSELTHLEHTFRGAPPNWPVPYPSFLSTLLKISVPWYPGMRYDDFWLSDPRPGIEGVAQWFRNHLH
jgi:predicted ATP-grasp superfamily ATP-dependent carboligase